MSAQLHVEYTKPVVPSHPVHFPCPNCGAHLTVSWEVQETLIDLLAALEAMMEATLDSGAIIPKITEARQQASATIEKVKGKAIVSSPSP